MNTGSIFIVLSCILCSVLCAKFPEQFNRCHQTDPDFNNCLSVNIIDALTKLKSGLPGFKIGPMEPLRVKTISLESISGPFIYKSTYNNLFIKGVTNITLSNLKLDLKKRTLTADGFSPLLDATANYKTQGRILLLPMLGEGACNVTVFNSSTHIDVQFEEIDKNGTLYWYASEFAFKIKPKWASMNFENLFKGNKELSDTLNRVLNENWEVFFQELGYILEKELANVLQELTNNFFLRIPINEIYLP